MAIIYHITTAAAWEEAEKNGYYEADSLATEGFMHCSEGQQVAGVLQRYFTGKENLVKVTIDTEVVQHRLQYDVAPSLNEAFPHLYGPLNIEAVIEVVPVNA